MRELRFLKQGDDLDHLVLATADGGEQFLLRVGTSMRDAVRAVPAVRAATAGPADPPPASAPEPAAAMGPREIQMRVRSGESPQQLAQENEMSLEKLMRFAGPVLQERARVADESRRARARRSTTEGQSVIFGEAVDERFGAHGIDASTVRWDARRRDDGQWVISGRWIGGEAERVAEWAFHLGSRNVAPLDDTAADLLSDRPIRAIVPTVPARPNLAAAPPLAPGVVAFPAMPDAHTGPLPKVDDVFDQEATDPDDPRGPGSVGASTPAPAAPAVEDYDAPPLPLRLAEAINAGGPPADEEPAASREVAGSRTTPLPRVTNLGTAKRAEESDEERAERARIPSWDDIMLGVRRKGD